MTNATSNSLMRRTKAELVTIILRKDETETKASEEIKILNKKVSEYEANNKRIITDYEDKIQNIKDSYNSVISILTAYNKRLKHTLIYIRILYIATLIIMIL